MGEPTKQRDGDQALPRHNDQPYVQDLLIADIEARKAVGVQRYGTPLQPFNGRDAVLDAYEEAVDLATYLRQVRIEQDQARAWVRDLQVGVEARDWQVVRGRVQQLADLFGLEP